MLCSFSFLSTNFYVQECVLCEQLMQKYVSSLHLTVPGRQEAQTQEKQMQSKILGWRHTSPKRDSFNKMSISLLILFHISSVLSSSINTFSLLRPAAPCTSPFCALLRCRQPQRLLTDFKTYYSLYIPAHQRPMHVRTHKQACGSTSWHRQPYLPGPWYRSCDAGDSSRCCPSDLFEIDVNGATLNMECCRFIPHQGPRSSISMAPESMSLVWPQGSCSYFFFQYRYMNIHI